MSNYYVSSVAYAAIAQWASGHAYSLGDYVRQLAAPADGSERVFKCTTAGTSGGSEPSWNLTNNGTTTDNTAHWTQISGQEAEQAAGNWKAASASFKALNAAVTINTGDRIFLSNDHSEIHAGTLTLDKTTSLFICVSRLGASLPPTETDASTGAVIGTSGNTDLTVGSGGYDGIEMRAGNGASGSASIVFATSGAAGRYRNCLFHLASTGTGSAISVSGGSFRGEYILEDCDITFAAAQTFSIGNGRLWWMGGTLSFAGARPSKLLNVNGAGGGAVTFRGIDLSAFDSALTDSANWQSSTFVDIINCKLNASVSLGAAGLTGAGYLDGSRNLVRLHNSDDATANRGYRLEELGPNGRVRAVAEVVRSDSADNGANKTSMRIEMNGSTPQLSLFVPAPSIARFIDDDLVGEALTLTLEVLSVEASAPLKNTFWADVEVLEDSGSPQSNLATSFPGWLSTDTLDTSTADWTAAASARANSHAYTTGDVIKVASNPGRLFYCTSGGTSAGSEPGGFASAVDGGSVTDSGAVFRAARRHKITVDFTPNRRGIAVATVKRIAAASNVSYADRTFDLAA